VVLLDLGLPDSQGLDTLLAVRAANPRLPWSCSRPLMRSSVPSRCGPEPRLPHQRPLRRRLLARSLRYAIERQLLAQPARGAPPQRARGRELQLLEAVVAPATPRWAPRLFGVRPLHDACGEIFTKLARRYGDILTHVVIRKRRLDPSVLDQLDTMAAGLAVLHAGPRDAVESMPPHQGEGAPDTGGEFSPYLERAESSCSNSSSQLAAHYRTQAVGTREAAEV